MFHVHTYRCGHAGGEREVDYVKKAIQLGAKDIVFTDHCPFPSDPFYQRMQMQELSDYVKTLVGLREKYVDQINIIIGLEAEYIPDYESYYQELVEGHGIDMLVLGQHFSKLADGTYSFSLQDKSCEAKVLSEGMIKGMESGWFSVVAHPDQIFRRCKVWTDEAAAIAKEIIEVAKRTGVILEKNIDNQLAYPKRRRYWPEFWQLCSPTIKMIYGLDAHSVEELEKHYLVKQSYEKQVLSLEKTTEPVYILAYGSECTDDYDVNVGVFLDKTFLKKGYQELLKKKQHEIKEYGYSLIDEVKIYKFPDRNCVVKDFFADYKVKPESLWME